MPRLDALVIVDGTALAIGVGSNHDAGTAARQFK